MTQEILNGKKSIRVYTDMEINQFNDRKERLKASMGEDEYRNAMKKIYKAKKYGYKPPTNIKDMFEERGIS